MPPFALTPQVRRWLSGIAVTLVCAAGVFVLGRRLDAAYPIAEWFSWQLLPIIGYALFFNVTCVMFGAFLVRRLLGQRELPALERLLFAMTLGLVAFVLALYVLGFCHLFKPAFALALPFAFLLAGARDARALFAELVAWRASIPQPRQVERILGGLAILVGGAALCFLYLEALDVGSINFDAAWYHYPIAQDYARTGGILPFPGEGHRAFPHLTSMIHTWALLVPGLLELPQRWMLSLHLEFTIVVWRIVAAAALARRLLGGRDVRGLWAAFFLFPSLFVYDQNIGGSADHFQGFFAVPVVLATWRAMERFDVPWFLLAGVALGGHVLVKYQGVYLFVAIALVVGVRLLFELGRAWRRGAGAEGVVPWRQALRGASALALAFTLVSAPHFVKNVAFYKNPVYPLAQSIFKSSTPKRLPGFYTETPAKQAFAPKGTGVKRQLWALGKMFDYSFRTANRNLTKSRPYMGSLFSLLLPCALLLPTRRRFGVVVAVTTLAFMVWANSAPNDRYLLSFYDLCIGTTLALMVELWELLWVARLGLVPLVTLQALWGGDAMLYYGRKRLDAAIEIVVEGYDGKYDARLGSRSTQEQVVRATPKDAVILARNYKGLLGLDRLVLSDIRNTQDYISYAHLKDSRDLYDLLRARGVTHLLYPKGDRRPERWNNTVLFTDLAVNYGVKSKRAGRLSLSELPKQAPPQHRPFLVAVSGIRGVGDGVWAVEQLDFDPRAPERFSPRPRPRYPLSRASSVLGEVQAVLSGRRGRGGLSEELLSEFSLAESWDGDDLYLRSVR